MEAMGEGREGDWECIGCKNRNYAFRSFCNRCKQPRLLVDSNTPSDSKWLPRIGDWICTGCTNNNYASREKCKKCGQSKEIAAMPAIAMPGATLPTYSHYFDRIHGAAEQKVNAGLTGNSLLQQSLSFPSGWPAIGADKFGVHPASAWSLNGAPNSGLPYANPINQLLMTPKGWRNGDWICSCGFHNYSSRSQCKKCGSFPPALGIKRLASDELVHDLDSKRLNIGHVNGQQQSYTGFEQSVVSIADPKCGFYGSYSSVSPSLQVPLLLPHQTNTTALLGKGAKQWREGDWMCTNCNNHNYASRSHCNRCKAERDALAQSVTAM